MDKKKDKLTKYQKKIVNNYINTINKKIDISGVLLFGSRVYGRPRKDSDVDLVVISPNFKRRNFDKRIDWLTWERLGIADTIAMDVFGYTPQEFATIEDESAIMAKAKKDGVWLYKK